MSRASERASRNADALHLHRDSEGAAAVAILLDPASGYLAIAQALVRSRRRHLSRGHVLCQSLNTTAKGCDPGTHARIRTFGIHQSLVDIGLTPWIAKVLAAASMKAMLTAVGDPTAQLRLTLQGLIVLACPNLVGCPALNDITRAFLAPYVAHELRAGTTALQARP